MNINRILTENSDPDSPDSTRGGSVRQHTPATNSMTKGMVAITIMLGVVVLCAVVLRASVGLVSDQPHLSSDVGVNEVSRSNAERRSDRALVNEQIREQARLDDRELLSRRHDRLWHEDIRDRPDKISAYQRWYREVEEIEAQLAQAELIQSELTPEQAADGPLAEGTVLWHRKQRLLELRSDAPQL